MLSGDEDDARKLPDARELVRVLVSQCSAVYIFLDGLDQVSSLTEHKKPQSTGGSESTNPAQAIFSFVRTLCEASVGPPVRLWCSSRETILADRLMQESYAHQLKIDQKIVGIDIASYLATELDQRISSSSGAEKTSSRTLHAISKVAGGNFLAASLMLQLVHVFGSTPDSFLLQLQDKDTVTVNELYEEYWCRLHEPANNSVNIPIPFR
jgi:hypothetical protein